jgi:hypothetical protein
MRLFLFLATTIGYLLLLGAVDAEVFQAKYTSREDVSWAITRPYHLADPYHQDLYDHYMYECNLASQGNCQEGEEYRLYMNRDQPSGVYNYTTVSFGIVSVVIVVVIVVALVWMKESISDKWDWIGL